MSHRHAASRDGLPIAFIHQPETNGANRRNVLMMSGISRACERLDQLIRLAQFGLPASPRSQIIEPAWNPGKTAVALHFNPKVQ
jgi:hypothetical protein